MAHKKSVLSVYELTLRRLAERARAVRLLQELQQRDLARMSGVSLATVRRFEKTGQAAFENVLRIAMALGASGPFEALFEPPPYRSLDEALGRSKVLQRQRVRRRT